MIMPTITGLAGGVGNGLGAVAAEEVRRLVRDRLGMFEEGRAALARLDEDPTPPEAEEGVRAQLTAALTGDPEFALRIQQAAQRDALRAGGNINSISIGGGVKGSTITIGPVTLKKTPGVVAALAALAVAMVLLLAFGGYGVVQLLRSDDSPAASSGSGGPGDIVAGDTDPGTAESGGSGQKLVTPIKDLGRFKAILPNLRSLPPGWSTKHSDEAPGGSQECKQQDCKGKLFDGSVLFSKSGTDLMFRVSSYDSATTALAGYASLVEATQELPDTSPMSLDSVGDESTPFSVEEYTGSETKYTMAVVVRVGTVVSRVDYGNSYDPVDPATALSLTQMIAERAQQAQNGKTPDAKTRL